MKDAFERLANNVAIRNAYVATRSRANEDVKSVEGEGGIAKFSAISFPQLTLTLTLALFNRAHGKAANELPGHNDAENDHRQCDQCAGGHDLTPWQFITAQKAGRDNRSGLSVGPRKHQCVQKFVPGKNETENGGHRNSGSGQR